MLRYLLIPPFPEGLQELFTLVGGEVDKIFLHYLLRFIVRKPGVYHVGQIGFYRIGEVFLCNFIY